jgi:hypothetical protein
MDCGKKRDLFNRIIFLFRILGGIIVEFTNILNVLFKQT